MAYKNQIATANSRVPHTALERSTITPVSYENFPNKQPFWVTGSTVRHLFDPIQLSILLLQVTNVRLDREFLAGGAFHDLIRGEFAAVLVNVFLEPTVERAELTPRNLVRNLRVRFAYRLVKLRAEDVTERVSLKHAADLSAKPMHVLQHAI